MAQLFIDITFPTGVPTVDRTFQLRGNVSWSVPSTWSLVSRSMSVQFGPGGQLVAGTFPSGNNWQCTGTVSPSTPWGSFVQLTLSARASFRFFLSPSEPEVETLTVSTTFMVRLLPPIAPTINLSPFTSPIVAAQVPLDFMFVGSATSPQAPIALVQYKVEGGQFANAVNMSGNWSQFSIRLPLPPTTGGPDHVLTIRAIDTFGTTGEISKAFGVQPEPPIIVPPGSDTTFPGAPTTSSITSWTRLEPQCTNADMGTSSSARIFDPLWMLTRQWQMGEFQAEDAGSPVQARVRATSAMLCRRFQGEVPKPVTSGPTAVPAQAYNPGQAPLEVLVERRRMRANDEKEARMLNFAVESGLHFLRMLEAQAMAKYRGVFMTKLAFQAPASAGPGPIDDATSRYVQAMVGRAPDGRQLATLLRTIGPAQLVLDPVLNIVLADRPKVQQAATNWLVWYDSTYSEPAGTTDDAWNPPRLEYGLSVGARLSATGTDEIAYSASEIDGPIDWSSFDVNTQVSLTTAADQGFTSIVECTIPAPVSFPGVPAPRFWEMEDARLAYGLVPVGPTDLAQLLMIEYVSSYGNDWFVVPLALPVGSVTRIESLVITDTFGVRSLIRPIGDPAIPPAHFALWQSSFRNPNSLSAAKVASNRFFLPPTLSRTIDSGPLEDVLFMRDEMANLAWAIERTVESPIEQPAQRYEAPDAIRVIPPLDPAVADLPRYLLSTQVPPNWIPLLPVQIQNPAFPNTPGQILSRLKRGAVLQPDGTGKVHASAGEVLGSLGTQPLYDEEVPREGARITRQRRMARWMDGSTWLWTSFRNQVGQGEGSSQLKFDQLSEPEESR